MDDDSTPGRRNVDENRHFPAVLAIHAPVRGSSRAPLRRGFFFRDSLPEVGYALGLGRARLVRWEPRNINPVALSSAVRSIGVGSIAAGCRGG